MMKALACGMLAGMIAICVPFSASWAGPIKITPNEKKFCADDYHKFCGEFGLESNALRNCMNRNGHSLSNDCIEALIDAGEVSRSEVERRKNASTTKTGSGGLF
jgi:hypothetical protein